LYAVPKLAIKQFYSVIV